MGPGVGPILVTGRDPGGGAVPWGLSVYFRADALSITTSEDTDRREKLLNVSVFVETSI